MVAGDLLTEGLYTISDAARFLREYDVSNRRIRGWVSGYSGTQSDPLIKNPIERLDDHLSINFLSLMEVRFVAFFVQQGVKVMSMRRMAQEAKAILQHDYPFATKTVFKTDGKYIFAELAEKTGDKRLYDLGGRNWSFPPVLTDSLHEGVVFDPEGTAKTWYPNKTLAPDVVMDPLRSFGQPVIDEFCVPTNTLWHAFKAEGRCYETVANWFEVTVEAVKQSVSFEQHYARPA